MKGHAYKCKSWTLLNSYVYVWPFMHCLYFIYGLKIYVRSHRKITHQWKSTLTDLINHEGMVVYLWERLEGRWWGYLVRGLSTVITAVLLTLRWLNQVFL